MKTSDKKKALTRDQAHRAALESFDLKAFDNWVKKYSPHLYPTYIKENEAVRTAVMCKQITNRTDMLATEAHRKAIDWLKQHRMSSRMF